MTRYSVTRSVATLAMVIAVVAFVALLVAVPVAGVHPMTVAFAGMLVVGAGILLRERVLIRITR